MNDKTNLKIDHKIIIIRNLRVMVDADLALLYEVQTKDFNRAVKRNLSRFPSDFMFQISEQEVTNLRCQFVTSSLAENRHGGRRYLPLVFTEQGVSMLSSILRSEKAASVNIEIIRSFVRLREMLISNDSLANKLRELEKKYDSQFQTVFDAIRALMKPIEVPTKRIEIIRTKE
ncbi:MAG: ORF6N domain-containing protein [Bdellovibrio sp.]|nr:ORF6N domain-containing protein [Bdellovibrio sp.]